MLDSEAAAHRHSQRDVIVCLNIRTYIYHVKGMRWNGHAQHGAFAWPKGAPADSNHDTRKGQYP
jgi:hypothetical protein